MRWDDHLQEYLDRPWQQRRELVSAWAGRFKAALTSPTESDINWFRAALQQEEAKWFVSDVVREIGFAPASLLSDLLRAAIKEPSPDDNRFFLEPCMDAEGIPAVQEQLIATIVSGSPAEQIGAASALYWTWDSPFSLVHLSKLFHAFLDTDDLELRQNLLPHLPLARPKCPEALFSSAQAVLAICSGSTDSYLQGRAKVQAGTSRLIPPVPSRSGA
jgi:hypothetical protein